MKLGFILRWSGLWLVLISLHLRKVLIDLPYRKSPYNCIPMWYWIISFASFRPSIRLSLLVVKTIAKTSASSVNLLLVRQSNRTILRLLLRALSSLTERLGCRLTQHLGTKVIANMDSDPDSLSQVEEAFVSAGLLSARLCIRLNISASSSSPSSD